MYRNRLARLPIAVAIAVEQRSMREERDRAEIKLRRSEAHYHALAENPHYGIFRFDLSGRFLTVNKALAAMLGYESTDELMARNLATDIIRDPAERAQLFESYRAHGPRRSDRNRMETERWHTDEGPAQRPASGRARKGRRRKAAKSSPRTSRHSALRRIISGIWQRQTRSRAWPITASLPKPSNRR